MPRMIDPYSDDDDNDDNVDKELEVFNTHQRRAAADADDDDDDDGDDGDDGDREPRSRERTGVELVQLDDDDDPADIDIDPPSRRRRRRDRGGLHAAYEGQIQQNARLQARLELLERQGQQRPEPEDDDEVEDLEAEIEELEGKQEQLLKSYEAGKANMTPDDAKAMRKEARGHERAIRDAQFEVNMRQHGLGKQLSQSEVNQAALRAQFTTGNPDIYANAPAHKLMLAKYQIARELRQEPDSIDLHDRCCEEVRHELRMEPRKGRGRPTDTDRRQTSGVSRSGGHGRRGRRSVSMTDERKAMADIAFAHITNRKKRHEAWAHSVGASLVKHGEA